MSSNISAEALEFRRRDGRDVWKPPVKVVPPCIPRGVRIALEDVLDDPCDRVRGIGDRQLSI